MAQLIINVDDAIAPRVLDSFARATGWTDTIDDGTGVQVPNPESKLAYSKRMLRIYIKRAIIQWEAEQAGFAAERAATQDAEATIILT